MGFDDIRGQVDGLSETLAGQVNGFADTKYYINQIIKLEKEIQSYIRHIHRSHWHPFIDKSHTHKNINTPTGGMSDNCRIFDPVDFLIMETYSIEDLDNNGKIYGRDFIIDPKDPEKPYGLTNAEQNIRMYYNTKLPYEDCVNVFGTLDGKGEIMSFSNYLSSVYHEQRRCPETLEGQLVQQLLLGINLCGQQEIYGHTFTIDPNDPNKPDFLKELEKDKILPKKTVSWKDFLKSKGIADTTPEHQPAVKQCDYVCTRLLGEWLHGVDIDGNGYIYGQDFFLEKNDPQKCTCLIEIESDVDWQPSNTIEVWNWEQFCNTFPNKNPDDRGDMKDD